MTKRQSRRKRRKSKKQSKKKRQSRRKQSQQIRGENGGGGGGGKGSPMKSKQTKYEECKQNIISGEIRAFNLGRLKTRTGAIVTSRKQAIAIAISVAEKKCKGKFTKIDHKKANDRMKQKLKKEHYNEHITITEVQRAIAQMKRFKSEKKYAPLRQLQRNVMARILMAFPPNETNRPIPNIILRDIQKYIVNYM